MEVHEILAKAEVLEKFFTDSLRKFEEECEVRVDDVVLNILEVPIGAQETARKIDVRLRVSIR